MRPKAPAVRQRISNAAARLFAVDRFHEVRMDDIAAEAGVSKGTLYRYFSDKEDLYRALVVAACDQLIGKVDSRVATAETPQGELEELVGAMFDFFEEHMYFFDLLQRVEVLDSSGPNAAWATTRQQLMHRIAKATAACQGIDGCEVPPSEHICGPMLLGAIRAVLRLNPPPRPRGLAQQLVQFYLFGVLAAERATDNAATL
jgi:AcrR family transcriptional regulator